MNAQDQDFEVMEERRVVFREEDEIAYDVINRPRDSYCVSFRPYPQPLDFKNLKLTAVLTRARGISFICYHPRTNYWYYMREVPPIDIELPKSVNILSIYMPEIDAKYEVLVKSFAKFLAVAHDAALDAIVRGFGGESFEEGRDDDEDAQMAAFGADF